MKTFELTKKQEKELKEWQEAIKKIFGEYGNYTFCFKPTGIGNGVTVECDLIGPDYILDLTDIDSW